MNIALGIKKGYMLSSFLWMTAKTLASSSVVSLYQRPGKRASAEGFRNVLDLPRGHALDKHSHQCRHEGLLAPLIAPEELRGDRVPFRLCRNGCPAETPVPGLGNKEGQGANPGR